MDLDAYGKRFGGGDEDDEAALGSMTPRKGSKKKKKTTTGWFNWGKTKGADKGAM